MLVLSQLYWSRWVKILQWRTAACQRFTSSCWQHSFTASYCKWIKYYFLLKSFTVNQASYSGVLTINPPPASLHPFVQGPAAGLGPGEGEVRGGWRVFARHVVWMFLAEPWAFTNKALTDADARRSSLEAVASFLSCACTFCSDGLWYCFQSSHKQWRSYSLRERSQTKTGLLT